MSNIGDFFAPLGFVNVGLLLFFVSSCEVIGFFLSKIILGKIPSFLRGAVWLLGLGLVVFAYFLAHVFVPLAFPTIAVCLVILLVPTLGFYLKEKAWQSLFLFFRENYLPFFLLLSVIPFVFIKSSLPPYIWDEMAYHYISPATLYYEPVWQSGIGFYENLPRLLETAYISLFSITKTYAVARLLHFFIFITAIVATYRFLKENFGRLPAILSFFLLAYHGGDLLFWSTTGYIDVGVTSFVLLGIICILHFVINNNFKILIIGAAFWGMAVGSKYSALVPLASYWLLVLVLVVKRRLLKREFIKGYLAAISLFLLVGGYWYLKNWVYAGNPVYPFLFGCQLATCTTGGVFGGWTTPFTLANASQIYLEVFVKNYYLAVLFLVGIPFSIFYSQKKIKKTLIFILLAFLVEILIAGQFIGYEVRYFFHWQLLVMVLLVLPTAFLFKNNKKNRKPFIYFTIILIVGAFYTSLSSLKTMYAEQFEPVRRMEIEYAFRKTNINGWIEKNFPNMGNVIYWCSENQEPKKLLALDPTLIWTSYEGLFRVFMTNCNLTYATVQNVQDLVRRDNLWIASLSECSQDLEIPDFKTQTPNMVKYYRLEEFNNKIICNSKKVSQGLYFSENKIKNKTNE